jgi:lipopolysaccharide transport system ATP-binding protein
LDVTDPRLELCRAGKQYRIYPGAGARLRELLTGRPCHTRFDALADVDLSASSGESIGVIGDNGAGKSTLLKLIAGVLTPTAGSLKVRGRLTAILELGVGFHPDFSGRENIFYGGALMGIPRAELEKRLDSIIDFAELGDFIDRPVKTYSSGMFVRLAFSLATSVDPDVLIVDEALAVGDQSFQKKCIDRMAAFKRTGCTILFCSHSMHHVSQFCDRAIWIDGGRVARDGPADEVISAYTSSRLRRDEVREVMAREDTQTPPADEPPREGWCVVTALEVENRAVVRGCEIVFKLAFEVLRARDFVFALTVDRADGLRVIAESAIGCGGAVRLQPGAYRVEVGFDSAVLPPGQYGMSVGLLDETLLHIDDFRTLDIEITDPLWHRMPAMARAHVTWPSGLVASHE